MKKRIGVMGSAQGPTLHNQKNINQAIELGHHIAESDCILVSGACPGLPDEAAFGAPKNGGFVMGISPAFSEREHIDLYHSPTEYYDIILYTGLGLMERDIINIRSVDAIVIVGGGIGTLNEFTIAYDEGKVVGILEESGGISDHIGEILKMCNREMNERIVTDQNPQELVKKVLEAIGQFPNPVTEDDRITGMNLHAHLPGKHIVCQA
ncbi:hypothetical protein IPJ72_03145 [Candidatus Peregrinibacteria bacterium]|nr:MAG: hypothetical protein IPJ72_03145 [Candidatus Peregrinibacteria bacterium]